MGAGYIPKGVLKIALTGTLTVISALAEKLVRRVIVYAPSSSAMEIAFEAGGETLEVLAGGCWDSEFMPESSVLSEIYIKGTGYCKVEYWGAK